MGGGRGGFILIIFINHRFNVDCGAAASLYGAVEGAFGSAEGAGGQGDGDAGTCPAPSGGSEEECAGAVSNCWSPGQRDTGMNNIVTKLPN